jgi:hypothetical protein
MGNERTRRRPMMGRPCEIVGGVVVRNVYAADLFSICLRGPSGESIGDDLTLALLGVKTATVIRFIDPPPHAMRLFDPDADGGRYKAADPGPCPVARDTAARMIARASAVAVRIPIAGPGFLETLTPGARVYGYLMIWQNGPPSDPVAGFLEGGESIADLLAADGHVLRCGALDDRRTA